MCKELYSNLHCRIYQYLLLGRVSLHYHWCAKPNIQLNKLVNQHKHCWRNGKKGADRTSTFPPPSSNGGTSSITGALLLAPLTPTPCCFSKAVKTRQLLKTTDDKQHYNSSQVKSKYTCYFSSPLFRRRCGSWWPRVKVGLERMGLITLNNPGYTCCLGSILRDKIFLGILWAI